MRHKKHSQNHRNHRGRGKFRPQNDSQSLARQKKHAQTQKEKYSNMARDAQVNGERVDAEYYFQHVEHYVRVLADIAEKEGVNERQRQEEGGDVSQDAHSEADDAQDMPSGEKDQADADNDNEESDADEAPKAARGRRRASADKAPRKPRGRGVKSSEDDASEEIPLPGSVLPEAGKTAANN